MIGNAWPVGDSGWSVLEEGELDRQTLQLRVTGWLVADPSGQVVSGPHGSRMQAETAAQQAMLTKASVR